MTVRKLSVAALLCLGVLAGCRRDASDVFVLARAVTVEYDVQKDGDGKVISSKQGFPGGKAAYFNIEATSIHAPLLWLEAESFDAKNGTQVFYHKDLDEKSYSGEIPFNAPAVSEATEMKFVFSAKDSQGYTGRFRVTVTVFPSEASLLEELSSITLHPGGNPDAFSFSSRQSVSSALAEGDADIRMTGDPLSPTLESLTGIKFVKAGSFDYSAATADGVREVFRNSLRTEQVTGLAEDDVILAGMAPKEGPVQGMAAIKIIAISGTRTILNIKMVK